MLYTALGFDRANTWFLTVVIKRAPPSARLQHKLRDLALSSTVYDLGGKRSRKLGVQQHMVPITTETRTRGLSSRSIDCPGVHNVRQ